eukprot:CAMPEP_0182575362 /NCGR_PEP_ID=MMETSP1324-20130603/29946_1 /TAXON_ID=236786 /ORGANISM="Florenciella sp., Strain RCC1587" /LENGTH=38 /DNA_ID= /DNA_START= /DNA_END= /DNA_ORIENTATION=
MAAPADRAAAEAEEAASGSGPSRTRGVPASHNWYFQET